MTATPTAARRPQAIRPGIDLVAEPASGASLAAAALAADVVAFDTSHAQAVPAGTREALDRWPAESFPGADGFDDAEAAAACEALAAALPAAKLKAFVAETDVLMGDQGGAVEVRAVVVAVGPAEAATLDVCLPFGSWLDLPRHPRVAGLREVPPLRPVADARPVGAAGLAGALLAGCSVGWDLTRAGEPAPALAAAQRRWAVRNEERRKATRQGRSASAV